MRCYLVCRYVSTRVMRRCASVVAAGLCLTAAACGTDRLVPLGRPASLPGSDDASSCVGSACTDANGGQGVGLPSTSILTPPTLCTSSQADVARAAATVSGSTLVLWPPDHSVRDVWLSDCVSPLHPCGGLLATRILGIACDEPSQVLDDGTVEYGIVEVGCDHALLRAARAGADEGRTYTITFLAADELGHTARGVCYVQVPHDSEDAQVVRGAEAYHVDAPASCPQF